ncbi:PAS domain-containing protein, partial [Escherichia coli]|nr:PAS domain-containing protein [Escherichia coli]
RWQLAAIPTHGWRSPYHDPQVMGLALAGSALSLAVAALLYLRQQHLQRLQARDRELSLAASVIESLNEAIMVTDADDRVVTVNPAF